ncbi:hypothetical protein BH23GEM3_BH23GEM3_00120 [soil metagenome]
MCLVQRRPQTLDGLPSDLVAPVARRTADQGLQHALRLILPGDLGPAGPHCERDCQRKRENEKSHEKGYVPSSQLHQVEDASDHAVHSRNLSLWRGRTQGPWGGTPLLLVRMPLLLV